MAALLKLSLSKKVNVRCKGLDGLHRLLTVFILCVSIKRIQIMRLPSPNSSAQKLHNRMHVILDIDNTLLHGTCSPVPDGCTCALQAADVNVVLRPHARNFLQAVQNWASTVSLWTNGAEGWAETVAKLVFPEVNWFCVLNVAHSSNAYEKRLRTLFDDPRYPHSSQNTVLIDDRTLALDVNDPHNVFVVKEWTVHNDYAELDTGLIDAWCHLKSMHDNTPVSPPPLPSTQEWKPNRPVLYDPVPFGLVNQGLECFFNSLVQVMLRSPTIVRCERERGRSLKHWHTECQEAFDTAEENDSFELLNHLLNHEDVTSLQIETTENRDDIPAYPHILMHTMAVCSQNVADSLGEEFLWRRPGRDLNIASSIFRVKPPERPCALAVYMQRAQVDNGKDHSDVAVSPRVLLPSGHVLELCGCVIHYGSQSNSGHYVCMFVRHDGSMWAADDERYTFIASKDSKEFYDSLRALSKNVSLCIYDVVTST